MTCDCDSSVYVVPRIRGPLATYKLLLSILFFSDDMQRHIEDDCEDGSVYVCVYVHREGYRGTLN